MSKLDHETMPPDWTGSNSVQQDQHFAPNFGSSAQNQKPIRSHTSDFRLQITSFRLQLPDCQISDSRLQTPNSTRSIDHGSSGPLFRHQIRQKYDFEETGMESRKLCTPDPPRNKELRIGLSSFFMKVSGGPESVRAGHSAFGGRSLMLP